MCHWEKCVCFFSPRRLARCFSLPPYITEQILCVRLSRALLENSSDDVLAFAWLFFFCAYTQWSIIIEHMYTLSIGDKWWRESVEWSVEASRCCLPLGWVRKDLKWNAFGHFLDIVRDDVAWRRLRASSILRFFLALSAMKMGYRVLRVLHGLVKKMPLIFCRSSVPSSSPHRRSFLHSFGNAK